MINSSLCQIANIYIQIQEKTTKKAFVHKIQRYRNKYYTLSNKKSTNDV